MAVLPGAVVGDLLERLAAERRRVVLDGFEPHDGEWSGRWSRPSAAAGRRAGAAAEAEVLERIADDLRADEPGQPAAADVVLALTMAIRREPDRAAVIVDAMLTDHPKLAVVIVATALRICPNLRREILAQARRHKPFSRHPFILGLLLALVAKVLADNSAEAAEEFAGLETPAEIVAALGRHVAGRRAGEDGRGGGDRGDGRAGGFGPLVAAPFVAAVLSAGDAWSRVAPPEDTAGASRNGSPNERGGREMAEALAGRRGSDDLAEPTGSRDDVAADRAAAFEGPGPAAGFGVSAEIYRPDAPSPPSGDPAIAARPMLAAALPDAGAPAVEAALKAGAVEEAAAAATVFERALDELLLAEDGAGGAESAIAVLVRELAEALGSAADDESALASESALAVEGGAEASGGDAGSVGIAPDPSGSTEAALGAGLTETAAARALGDTDPMANPISGSVPDYPAGLVGDWPGDGDASLPDIGGTTDIGADWSVGAVEASVTADADLAIPDGEVALAIDAGVAAGPVEVAAAADLDVSLPDGAVDLVVDAELATGPVEVAATADADLALSDGGAELDFAAEAEAGPVGTEVELAIGAGNPDVELAADLALEVGDLPAPIAEASVHVGTSPGEMTATAEVALAEVAEVEAAVTVGPEEPEILAAIEVDNLLSLDLALTETEIAVDLDLLADPPPIVDELADTIETLVAEPLLGGMSDTAGDLPSDEPPSSVLYSLGGALGGLFG